MEIQGDALATVDSDSSRLAQCEAAEGNFAPQHMWGQSGPHPGFAESKRGAAALSRSLDRLAVAIIVLDRDCRILDMNAAARDLAGRNSFIRCAGNQTLLFKEPIAAELHRHMVDWPVSEPWHDRPIRISRAQAGVPVSVVLTMDPESAGRPISATTCWLLFVFDLINARPLSSSAIAEDLQITHREAQIAALLAEGEGLTQTAYRMGIKPHTARSHLRSMFEKVGVRSQGMLLRRILAGPAGWLTGPQRRQVR